MARALNLSGYLAQAKRGAEGAFSADAPRPAGIVIWCHAHDRPREDIVLKIADRLAGLGRDVSVLLTTPDAPDRANSNGVIYQQLPQDSGTAIQAFLDTWAPDLCIWTVGGLRAGLLNAAHRRGVPLFLVDADEAHLSRSGWRFLPDSSRAVIRRFSLIMARSPETEHSLRRRGGVPDRGTLMTGALSDEAKPLPCNEKERDELAAMLRLRPVWLAARLHLEELATVLKANHMLLRKSHRALLVIVPEDPAQVDGFHDALKQSGVRYITWSEGELPNEATQVILADTEGELGLWYRLAPLSFMGGSLAQSSRSCDPNEPAAHGSAILYGPNIRAFLDTYSRFAEAGAARIVRDADTLASALQQVIAPDQSAAMAHAAWEVSTRGAAVMDRLMEEIQTALDERGAG